MSEPVEVDVYLQVQPEWSLYGDRVIGATVVRHTKNPPGRPVPNVVTVKATLRIPQSAFEDLYPSVVVDVPAPQPPVIEGEAT